MMGGLYGDSHPPRNYAPNRLVWPSDRSTILQGGGSGNEDQGCGPPVAEPRESRKNIILQNKPNSPIKSYVFSKFLHLQAPNLHLNARFPLLRNGSSASASRCVRYALAKSPGFRDNPERARIVRPAVAGRRRVIAFVEEPPVSWDFETEPEF